MGHSNSSLNCFAACMKKYEHSYILHTEPCKPTSPHLEFGVMAHDVLHKAGLLRDAVADKVVGDDEYIQVIPSEVLYENLKQEFRIPSWNGYFVPVIKQTAKYEQELLQQLIESNSGDVTIEREVKLQVTVEQMRQLCNVNVDEPFVGIIDCLLYTKDRAIILDYKFSSNKKTQDDFDMNSQLPLYAFLIHTNYDIPLHNIQYGYIDIPKQAFERPILLSNGTLSRSKSQNVSADMYKACVQAVHGTDDEYYNCEPGGHYYDCWCALQLNKAAYLSLQYLDFEVYEGILSDLLQAAVMIDYMKRNKMSFIKKYDSYSCKNCEYLKACKPWLEVGSKYE